MNVRRSDNPREFAERTNEFLLANEAENCFFIGHLPTLPNPTAVLLLCVVDPNDRVVAVAFMTPGRHMVTTRAPADAVVALAAYLHEHAIPLPGIQSPPDAADVFLREWERLTGRRGHSPVGMAVHQITRVIPPARPAAGAMRTAQPRDLDLIARWVLGFSREIHESYMIENARAIAERRVAAGEVVIWQDAAGEPVAMAGSAGATPHGVRVNLVYTPREFRNRGYASSLVAALSAQLLAAGRRFCFLYTDLANPTSNKIYRAIGYEPVGESVRFMFE